MNLTEFLEKLEETRNGWFELGPIVRKKPHHGHREHCPITAVCLKVTRTSFDAGDYLTAAAKLGLTAATAQRVADAADTRSVQPRLRARLLKAVGLK